MVSEQTQSRIERLLATPEIRSTILISEKDEEDGTLLSISTQKNYDFTGLIDNMKMPLSAKAYYCVGWMKEFFDLVGDHNPNSNEIHLEKQDKKEIYDLYLAKFEGILDNEDIVSYSYFNRLWDKLFSHVRIREYKAVTGKCHFCAVLTEARGKSQKENVRARVTDMHALHRHRSTYMSERKRYYDKVKLAVNDPQNYMSIIIDGMAKNHTVLPHIANMKQFPCPLPMHLQGVIEHGQRFTLYRTFVNVNEDSNLAIHCILRQMEDRMQRFQKLPPTIFIQIDGGSENANKYVLGLCEFLVARRLTSKIYLTRLPVGHTHEDIDARFGKLWVYIRSKLALSPAEYTEAINNCFGTMKLPFRLEDIFVVPNYKALFEPYIDSKLSGYTKEEDTQLAWKFEAVEISEEKFPLGVRTMYRSYASNEVFEIINNENSDVPEVPYGVCFTKCRWQPVRRGQQGFGIPYDGLHLLQSFPIGPIIPASFQPGHLKEFQKCFDTIADEKWCGNSAPRAIRACADWLKFKEEIYPQTENAEEYLALKNNPMYVPLRETLWDYLDVVSFHADDDDSPDVATFQLQGPLHPRQDIDNAKFGMSILTSLQTLSSMDLFGGGDRMTAEARAIRHLIPLTAISMPSVITSLSSSTDMYIPPRVRLSNQDIQEIVHGNSSLSDIAKREMSKPLFYFDAYMELKATELKTRVQLRKIIVPGGGSNPNKTQLCNALVAADESELKQQQQQQQQQPQPPPLLQPQQRQRQQQQQQQRQQQQTTRNINTIIGEMRKNNNNNRRRATGSSHNSNNIIST